MPSQATVGTGYDIDGGHVDVVSELTTRGEMANQPMLFAQGPALYQFKNRFANGAQCAMQNGTCQMDSRSNLLRSWDAPLTVGTTAYDTSHTIGYDAAGRQITDTAATCNGGGYTAANITSQRTYDAENHIIAQTLPANYETNQVICPSWVGGNGTYLTNTNNAYTWGPDSHLTQWSETVSGNAPVNVTLGWDGDDLLYQYYAGGVWIDIEKLGILGGTYFSIYDRDWSGSVAMAHESQGYSRTTSFPSFPRCQGVPSYQGQGIHQTLAGGCYGGNGAHPSDFSPVKLVLDSQRSDGYGDGVNVFQGVRAYDPNMNQWTTPDAYAGDVHDPMSQKPYMWNANNPVQYSDPSGYTATVQALQPDDSGRVKVNITMYVNFSAGTDQATKDKIKNDISKTWGGSTGKYDVTMNVLEATASTPAALVNKIDVGPKGTHYGGDMLNNTMHCDAYGNETGYGHEAGHLMGLVDGYLGAGTASAVALPAPGRDKDDIMVRLGGHPTTGDIEAVIDPSNTWVVHH